MESHGGFSSLPTIEEVVTTLILLCAALYCQIKSEMESLMGFKFQPSNEQIFCLLEKKRLDPHFSHHTIKDIDDICSLEPWDLPGASKTESEDQVRYFFYKPYYKYRESTRAHRRTTAGYWKVTGRGSKIKARNGLTGTKKILTFYCHGPASKKAKKSDWVMHEYHVKDDPSYKKEFVLCRIERKWDNKRGISTTDEGESRQQLVSPIQLSPRDPRNHGEESSLTNPQQLPNHNLISYPGNHFEQNTLTFPQLIPNASLVSPTQLLPSDQLNSNRIHSEENILTNQQLQPSHNLVYHFGNQIEENSPTNPQLLPNTKSNSFPGNLIELPTELLPSDRLISMGNHIEENIITNHQLHPNHNLIYHFGNQIEQNSPTNPQLTPNSNLISFPGNLIQQNTLTHPQLIPNHGLISPTLLLPSDHLISKQNLSEENSLKSLHLQPNHYLISNFGNQILENSPTNPQLPPNSNLESQLLLNQPMVIHDFAENTFQEERLLPGESNACGSSNRRNNDSFSAMQPINQEQEFIYSNCSFGNCDFFDQINVLINSQRAFEDENSRKETGRTLTPDLDSSKSDGGASTYAEDSSDTNNTADIDAWLNALREYID